MKFVSMQTCRKPVFHNAGAMDGQNNNGFQWTVFLKKGLDRGEIGERWKYLLDQYTKCNPFNEGRSGDPSIKIHKWKYYDLLSFLCHVKQRETDGNLSR